MLFWIRLRILVAGLVMASLPLLLGGCSTLNYAPPSAQNTQCSKEVIAREQAMIVTDYDDYYGLSPKYIEHYNIKKEKYLNADSRNPKEIRNSYVNLSIQIDQCKFHDYANRLSDQKRKANLVADLTVLTLSGIGASTGNIATASALAAASAGVVGAKAAISQDLFYKETIPALIAQMSAHRDAIVTQIYKNEALGIDAYPLSRAGDDLTTLASASNIAYAISALNAKAEAQKQAAQSDKLKAEIEAQSEGPHSVAVRSLSQYILDEKRIFKENPLDSQAHNQLVAISKALGVDPKKQTDLNAWQTQMDQSALTLSNNTAEFNAVKAKLKKENIIISGW